MLGMTHGLVTSFQVAKNVIFKKIREISAFLLSTELKACDRYICSSVYVKPNAGYINIGLMSCVTVYQFRWTGAVFLFGSQSLERCVMLITNHLGPSSRSFFYCVGPLVILTFDLEGNGSTVAGLRWLGNN